MTAERRRSVWFQPFT